MFIDSYPDFELARQDLLAMAPDELRDQYARDQLRPLENDSIENGLIDLGDVVRSYVDETVQPESIQPTTRYGRAVQEYLVHPHTARPTQDLTRRFCFEAELTLVASIEQATADPVKVTTSRPAVLLADQTGDPIGFIKQFGLQTLYTWKPVTLPTAEGPVHVPAASFSQINLSSAVHLDTGKRVQTVVASKETIDHTHLGRLDMSHFPEDLREEVAETAIYKFGNNVKAKRLERHIDQAASYQPSDIAPVIGSLLVSNRV